MRTHQHIVAAWIPLAALAAALGMPDRAVAQTADEYVLILLDRSASMGDAAVTGAVTPTFWDNALAAAQSRVHQDKLTLKGDARPTRAYAVWTFFDDTCSSCPSKVCGCPNTQKNVKQLWPQAVADCGTGEGGGYESATDMCVFASGGAGDKMYDQLKNKVLPGLSKQRPGSHGNTPLADSLCYAVERLQRAAHDKPKIIELETDGGETSSSSPCAGFGSVALPDDSFDHKRDGWGLTSGSWQENFLRRTIRIGRFMPRPDDPTANASQEKAAVKFARGVLLPGERLLSTLSFRTDLHYAICDPASPSSTPCADTDRSADIPARELFAKTGPKRPSILGHEAQDCRRRGRQRLCRRDGPQDHDRQGRVVRASVAASRGCRARRFEPRRLGQPEGREHPAFDLGQGLRQVREQEATAARVTGRPPPPAMRAGADATKRRARHPSSRLLDPIESCALSPSCPWGC
jgi:hypothetical protein